MSQLFASGGQSWSFSFNISPSNEHPGLISFRMDWFDLAVQGSLKSLLQNQNLKASVLQHSAFFMVQLSHPYMATGKTVAFTRQTFVGKAMSLLSNMLSRLVITYLPKSKHLSISWLKSPSTMIFFFFFSYLEPVCCSMSSFNCCFLTCIQVSQEAGQVVWYSHLFQNFPQFTLIQSKALT